MPVNLIVGNDDGNALDGTAGTDLIYGYDPNGPQSEASAILATRVATGLTQPIFAGAPSGDTSRLFIVEKTGLIKILDLVTGTVAATPFLNVSGEIVASGERGLLGLAFDPNFSSNGFFYVYLINTSGDAEIRRYHVSSNPNVADVASVTPIITIDQTDFGNHKAGWIGFGPDGYLYIASGDGAVASNAQTLSNLLGKILRIDVHGDGFPGDPERNYAVPADNPFMTTAGAAGEIFALGLRNPWRDSFDRGLGDLYIADVGASQFEEVNLGQAGANYGWPVFEGPPGSSPPTVGPIHFYDRSVGQSITGGYVYRGEAEALQGQYFFADFVQGKVFTLRFNSTAWVATDRTAQIVTDFGAVGNVSSFGEDARGNLYLVDFDGDIFRLTPIVASADQADILRGFGGNDLLYGGSGNDTLDGGAGADTMTGSVGSDTFDFVAAADMVSGETVNGGDDTDTMRFSPAGTFDFRVVAFTSIERLEFNNSSAASIAVFGSNQFGGMGISDTVDIVADPDSPNLDQLRVILSSPGSFSAAGWMFSNGTIDILSFRGTSGDDTITGSSRNDILNGGGNADLMLGLGGDDWYFVDHVSDRAVEVVGGGSDDRVLTSGSYTLEAGSEIELLRTTNPADTTAINLTGNALANSVVGNAGANIVNGGGNADLMQGFGGDDWYFVDHVSDRAVEAVGGGGDDRVLTAVSYTLEAGSEIELLRTTNPAGTTAINLTGNAFANSIVGNAGANVINGGGGVDMLIGLGGNDWYFVDHVSDRAVEAVGGGGDDRVLAAVSYTLEAGSEIELLRTTNPADTTAINLTGNAFANSIVGTAGANIINGGGNADLMQGFGGNDRYFVDNAGDRAVEAIGGGGDRVLTSVSYTLEADSAIELFTTTITSGTAAINLTGNEFANSIVGNAGTNILNGLGGNDTLTGFSGNDSFRFTTTLNAATNVDQIADFNVANDTIQLDDAVFIGLAAGALNPNAFRIGAAAADADDRIIYNSATGALFFDSNGNDAGGATQFAALATGLPLTNADFFVI